MFEWYATNNEALERIYVIYKLLAVVYLDKCLTLL